MKREGRGTKKTYMPEIENVRGVKLLNGNTSVTDRGTEMKSEKAAFTKFEKLLCLTLQYASPDRTGKVKVYPV